MRQVSPVTWWPRSLECAQAGRPELLDSVLRPSDCWFTSAVGPGSRCTLSKPACQAITRILLGVDWVNLVGRNGADLFGGADLAAGVCGHRHALLPDAASALHASL